MKAKRNLLFSGPTLHSAMSMSRVDVMDVVLLPPVQRGDIDRIVGQAGTDVGCMLIVDGFFHLKTLAVGHAEIRNAIRRGWKVWGLSSMGAIRAAEMHHLGMRGYGECFETFARDPDFRDDEVALLHEPNPPYRMGSEPLIHMRKALSHLRADGLIDEAMERAVLDVLSGMWFGERDLATFRRLVRDQRPDKDRELAEALQSFDRFRIKSLDLLAFLREKPYLQNHSS